MKKNIISRKFRFLPALTALTLTAALLLTGCGKGGSTAASSDEAEAALFGDQYDLTDLHLRIQETVTYDGTYRSQLTVDEQLIYDALVQHFIVERSPAKNFTIDFSSHQYDYPDGEVLDWAVTVAREAFIDDYPACFWVSCYKDAYQSIESQDEVINMIANETYDKANDDVEKVFQDIEKAVNAVKAERASDSRYDTVKAIHDYICRITDYDNATYNKFYGSDAPVTDISKEEETSLITSGLVSAVFGGSGKGKAVCAGYAKAFKLLCAEFDIPCFYVTGVTWEEEEHAWNEVQMEDGKWYGMDVTWDDATGKLDYFLCGSATPVDKDSIFTNKAPASYTFGGLHLPRNGVTWMPVEDPDVIQMPAVLTFPAITEEAYAAQ